MSRVSTQLPSTTLTSIGTVVYDVGAVARNPGIKYWPLIFIHAWRVFKSTTPLAIWLCFFIGAALVIQTTNSLAMMGVDRGLAGVGVGALGLRELSISVVILAMAATAGAGFVTELGSMRVADEIDALDVMGIHSHAYLVSTRLMGTFIAAVPLIIFCVAFTFIGGWVSAWSQRATMSMGSFAEFFWLSVASIDFLYVAIKGAVIASMIAVICVSHGYRASGGPVGVGLAVGRALDLSIVGGILLNLALTYVFWGTKETLQL